MECLPKEIFSRITLALKQRVMFISPKNDPFISVFKQIVQNWIPVEMLIFFLLEVICCMSIAQTAFGLNTPLYVFVELNQTLQHDEVCCVLVALLFSYQHVNKSLNTGRIQILVLTTLPKIQNLKSSFGGEFMFSSKSRYGCWWTFEITLWQCRKNYSLQYFEYLCYQWHNIFI